MAGLGIKYSVQFNKSIEKYGTAWENSLDYLGNSNVMSNIGKVYRYYITRKVPKLSGNLRRAARVVGVNHGFHGTQGMASVTWVETGAIKDYWHYQFVGRVYGPNRAVFKALGPNQAGPGAGVQSGWCSPVTPKHDMGRMMGQRFTKTLHDGRVVHVDGYTTPGTGPDWINAFVKDEGDYGEKAVNILVGRYIYDWFCKASKGTSCETPHYGGWVAYNRCNQIKDIRD